MLGVPLAFRLPDGLSIRYDAPDAALAEAVTGYHVYTATAAEERVDWFLPGTADICIARRAADRAVHPSTYL